MPTNNDHSKRDHALLSASGAHRWLNCTPSARLEDEFAVKESSTFAEEGTLAHELAEIRLENKLGLVSDDVLKDLTDSIAEGNPGYSQYHCKDMDYYVQQYVDYCYEASKSTEETIVYIEEKLNLSKYVPNSFGTADCIVVSGNTVEVIDLKYGKGVPVSPEWNPQFILYALGTIDLLELYTNIENVILTVVQPRLNNIQSWSITKAELLAYADSYIVPRAKLAYEGKGELQAGDWCRFCGVKNQCRKLYERQMELAKYDFSAHDMLTDEDISEIVLRAPEFIEWLNSITAYAQDKAIKENKRWPGLKLVEGRSIRRWDGNPDDIANIIKSRAEYLTDDDLYDMKLKGITDLEKSLGKKAFATIAGDLVIKPQGKPTLVPESDKRQEIGLAQAKEEFS